MFQRCLLVLDSGAAPERAAWAVASFAAPGGTVQAVVHPGPASLLGLGLATESWSGLAERLEAGEQALAALERHRRDGAAPLAGEALLELTEEALVGAAAEAGAQAMVVVTGPGAVPRRLVSLVHAGARTAGIALVWVGPAVALGGGPPRQLLCPFDADIRGLAPIGAFLAAHAGAIAGVTALALREPDPPLGPRPEALAELQGLGGSLTIARATGGLLDVGAALDAALASSGAELLGAPLDAASGLTAAATWAFAPRLIETLTVPWLLVPSAGPPPGTDLDATDALDLGDGRLRLHVDRLNALGQPTDPGDEPLWVVARGRPAARLVLDEVGAVFQVAADPPPHRLGLLRREPQGTPEAFEATAAVVRLGLWPVTLLDAALPEAALADVARIWRGELDAERRQILAVRCRRAVAVRKIRRGLAGAELGDVPVVDAAQVLDDAGVDLPEQVEPLRLHRVARHLRAAGVPVDSLVSASPLLDGVVGLAALTPERLATLAPGEASAVIAAAFRPPPAATASVGACLDELCGAAPVAGNAVQIELDNEVGRGALLDTITAATVSLHLQAYILRDDPFTRGLAEALVAVAARGVAVRILVDSLHGGHGSFGSINPVLEALSEHPGVEVRAVRPIEGLPSLADLKHRDHRKLLIADGRVGIVSGRNLARVYYTAFHEAEITPETDYREVPWLDGAAVLRGPIVAQLAASFADQWQAVGGGPLPVTAPPPAGATAVRLVLHRGLADTNTLDTYIALIRSARDHLTVVNTFPLQAAIQRALRQALERGVRVTVLFGNVLPLFVAPDGSRQRFAGGVGALRQLATQLVRARLDALAVAGAHAYEFAVTGTPGRPEAGAPEPGALTTLPHVHAKILSVDGRVCTVGSANLDVTAGYWESEALAVIEDPAVTAELDATLATLVAQSLRVDPADPDWQQRSARRAWLSRAWPTLIG